VAWWRSATHLGHLLLYYLLCVPQRDNHRQGEKFQDVKAIKKNVTAGLNAVLVVAFYNFHSAFSSLLHISCVSVLMESIPELNFLTMVFNNW
jgi:hypothetical protein